MPEKQQHDQYLSALLFALTDERTDQDFEDYRIDTPIYRNATCYPPWDSVAAVMLDDEAQVRRRYPLEIYRIPLLVIPYFFKYMSWFTKLREEYPDKEIAPRRVANMLMSGLPRRLAYWQFRSYKRGLACWEGTELLRDWENQRDPWADYQCGRGAGRTVDLLIVAEIILAAKYPYKFCQSAKDGFLEHMHCADERMHDHTAVFNVWKHQTGTLKNMYEFEKNKDDWNNLWE